MYYLHDKEADTSERVAWTHTHNLATNDPEKAFRYMAWTAMSAEQLKAEAGVARTGRKATAGPVYSFSLAWHPEQQPGQEEMMRGAFDTLEGLGLMEHESVMVAHRETEHPHVHVICNLVHPETGRTAVPSYDYLTLSKWAEEKEREDGKIYCDQRVQNNERRRQEAKKDRDLALVKHREEKAARAQEIETLYSVSDSGKAFQAGLEEAGYTLAKGDKRGYVLVNDAGDIFSLSRQLKGQRAKDIKGRLSDIDQAVLPQAKILSDERKHFYRDDYEAKQQMAIVDAAIKAEQQRKEQGKENQKRKPAVEDRYRSYAEELDPILEKERAADRMRSRKEEELKAFYRREELEKQIAQAKAELEKKGVLSQVSGRKKALQEEIDAMQKNLDNITRREQEQRSALEAKIREKEQAPSSGKSPEETPEQKRERIRQMFMEQAKSRDQDRGPDLSR